MAEAVAAISREFAERGVCAIAGLLGPNEVELLRRECSALRESISDAELCDLDCCLELPTDAAEDDPARSDADAYLRMRAPPSESGALEALRRLVLSKLPAAAAAALGRDDMRLFNEHYVVKPAKSAQPFGWHTDAAHQLEALVALRSSSCTAAELPRYLSIWIPLDPIDSSNGALVLLPATAPQPPRASPLQPAQEGTEAWLDSCGSCVSASNLEPGDAVL
jgi:hypothetical protein